MTSLEIQTSSILEEVVPLLNVCFIGDIIEASFFICTSVPLRQNSVNKWLLSTLKNGMGSIEFAPSIHCTAASAKKAEFMTLRLLT